MVLHKASSKFYRLLIEEEEISLNGIFSSHIHMTKVERLVWFLPHANVAFV